MTVLSGEEEAELCHYHLVTPRHSFVFFGFWTVFIIVIVFMNNFNNYSGPIIPWDNCDMNKTWEPAMRSYINKEQYKSEQLKVIKFREKNSLYRRNNYSRIEYGTTLLSYCKAEGRLICDWESRTAQVSLPDGPIIKSVTRSIELDPYFASGLRFMILECISFRITMSLVRTTDVLTSRSRPFPRVVQYILSTSPLFSVLQSVSLFSITVLHSEFDATYISMFHPYAYICLGVFTILEMFLDLVHDAFDARDPLIFLPIFAHFQIRTPRFYFKSTSFIAFSACYPQVVLNWLSYFKLKKCHAYVPLTDGLFEYICAAATITYHFINSQVSVHMLITPTIEDEKDVSTYPREVYFPHFQIDKSLVYESLSDQK